MCTRRAHGGQGGGMLGPWSLLLLSLEFILCYLTRCNKVNLNTDIIFIM